APGGSFGVAPQQPAIAQQSGQKARQRVLGRQSQRDPTALLGLGAQGLTENGINLNLSPTTAVAVIGQKQLIAERARDGERRRSEHQGSWKDQSFQNFKSSIENYVAGVKPGNTTALGTAHSPFANYLNAIHQRLHPIFADRFLTSLARLPSDHPLNDMEMHTNLEIVLSPDDGRIIKMGITKPSGVTAFDIGALDSVRKASPFGAAPAAIVSPDGNVYLHWGFYRKPDYACSTYNARPYMLKTKPKSAPPEVPAPAKPDEGEQGRQGSLPAIDDAGENAVRTAQAD
ncbi:MAG TPA: energy transducer TonB, partial [Polyangiaceae bacterium]|nr:energy transducer TonB [Polyangiaceae bacterium]